MSCLATLRSESNLSQQQLAKISGISQSTISDIESGKTPHPRIDTLTLLARALKTPLTRLLETNETETTV